MSSIKIYIAGKVTGEDYQKCFDKFRAIEDTLTGVGYQVINPMNIVPKGTDWEESMEILKPHLINADVAFFLSDWKQSDGAQLERHWALHHNITIVDYKNLSSQLLMKIKDAV